MNRALMIRFALAAALLAAAGLLHAQYDRPAKRLQVSVRFDDSFDASTRSVGASGRAASDGSRLEIRARESSASGQERVDQRVLVLEGGRALIYTGSSQPMRERRFIQTPGGVVSQEVTVVQDTRMGFEVVPRVTGSSVQVDIAGATGYTSASGPLGQWFELGAVASAAGSRRAWIKVEALP